jgi:hypothetical protein
LVMHTFSRESEEAVSDHPLVFAWEECRNLFPFPSVVCNKLQYFLVIFLRVAFRFGDRFHDLGSHFFLLFALSVAVSRSVFEVLVLLRPPLESVFRLLIGVLLETLFSMAKHFLAILIIFFKKRFNYFVQICCLFHECLKYSRFGTLKISKFLRYFAPGK